MITSRDNPKLKSARSVRDGREPDLVFIEGVRLLGEAIRSNVEIVNVFVSQDFGLTNVLPDHPEAIVVEKKAFRSIADTENPQGVIAIARRPQFSLTSFQAGLTVLLHEVNNPANLGAVIRTAEAAGASGLMATTGSADAFSSKSIRASMGSAFRLPIVEEIDFFEAVEWAKSAGLVTTAADVASNLPYFRIDWTVPRLVIFGSEAHGLDEVHLAAVEQKIVIPIDSKVESLNLAVSSGIILFEARRHRKG